MALQDILSNAIPENLRTRLSLNVVDNGAAHATLAADGENYELRQLQSDHFYLVRIDGAKREYAGDYPLGNLAGYLERLLPPEDPIAPEPNAAQEPAVATEIQPAEATPSAAE
jgi:hypothetical protein